MTLIDGIDTKRRHDLTIEEVKMCPCFSHLSDMQAQEIVDSIVQLSKIIYDSYIQNKLNSKPK